MEKFDPFLVGNLLSLLEYRAQHKQFCYQFIDERYQLTELSIADLQMQAKQLSVMLLNYAQSGDRAIIACSDNQTFLIYFFACLYANIVAVPCSYPKSIAKSSRLIHIIDDCQPSLLLTQENLVGLAKIICGTPTSQGVRVLDLKDLDNKSKLIDKIPATNISEVSSVNAETVAFLQYSSGTTGKPKGTVLTHRNVLINLQQMSESIAYTENDVGLSWLPPYHDMGLTGGVLQALYSGCQLLFMSPRLFARQPYSWLKLMSDYKVTVTGGPGFAYEYCIDKITEAQMVTLDLQYWRVANIGAEVLHPQTIKRFYKKFAQCGFSKNTFCPTYGMSETTLFVSGAEKSRVSQSFDKQALTNCRVQIVPENSDQQRSIILLGSGIIANGIDAKIIPLNSWGKDLDKSMVGEVCLRGPNIGHAYWRQKDDDSLLDKEGYFRTGDVGFIYDQQIFILDRVDQLIKQDSKLYYPEHITYHLSHNIVELPANGAALISGPIGDVILLQELKLNYRKVDLNQLEEKINSLLSDYIDLVISKMIFVKPQQLPRTSSGKIQYHQCRHLYGLDQLTAKRIIK